MGTAERWQGHPPLPGDLSERLDDIVSRLRRGGADLIYVFGSAVRPDLEGSHVPGDLDLAVHGLDEDVWRVRADLEKALGTDRLDLVRLEETDPELRFEVIARGRLLYAASRELENDFELRALREYRDLAPLRRVQRDHLRARHGIRGR